LQIEPGSITAIFARAGLGDTVLYIKYRFRTSRGIDRRCDEWPQDFQSSDISNSLQLAATNLPKNLENASRIRGRLVGGCKKNAERNAESG